MSLTRVVHELHMSYAHWEDTQVYNVWSLKDFIELLPHLATGIRTPSQSNMPIKGNALKTSFQHLELNLRDYSKSS